MTDVVVALVASVPLGCALFWFGAPRVFTVFDRRMARGRLVSNAPSRIVVRPPRSAASSAPASSTHAGDQTLLLASLCDSVARSVRSGQSMHEAVRRAIDTVHPRSEPWLNLRRDLGNDQPLRETLARAVSTASGDDQVCLRLLTSSFVGGVPVAAAIDHAASVLREIAQCRGDLAVAVAHTRFSVRILTALPFALLLLSVLTSSSVRHSLVSARVLVPLLLGAILNRAGNAWIGRVVDASVAGAHSDGLTTLVDRVCVSLRAGVPVAHACASLDEDAARSDDPTSHEVAARIHAGRPLDEALEPLGVHHGLPGRMFADALVSADRDGLPIVPLVTRIAAEVRAERRRRVDIAVRQLPSRLAIPLVTCILPAFLLVTMVPLVVASFSSLTLHLPLSSPMP